MVENTTHMGYNGIKVFEDGYVIKVKKKSGSLNVANK